MHDENHQYLPSLGFSFFFMVFYEAPVVPTYVHITVYYLRTYCKQVEVLPSKNKVLCKFVSSVTVNQLSTYLLMS